MAGKAIDQGGCLDGDMKSVLKTTLSALDKMATLDRTVGGLLL
jgi:hypothetical protein